MGLALGLNTPRPGAATLSSHASLSGRLGRTPCSQGSGSATMRCSTVMPTMPTQTMPQPL